MMSNVAYEVRYISSKSLTKVDSEKIGFWRRLTAVFGCVSTCGPAAIDRIDNLVKHEATLESAAPAVTASQSGSLMALPFSPRQTSPGKGWTSSNASHARSHPNLCQRVLTKTRLPLRSKTHILIHVPNSTNASSASVRYRDAHRHVPHSPNWADCINTAGGSGQAQQVPEVCPQTTQSEDSGQVIPSGCSAIAPCVEGGARAGAMSSMYNNMLFHEPGGNFKGDTEDDEASDGLSICRRDASLPRSERSMPWRAYGNPAAGLNRDSSGLTEGYAIGSLLECSLSRCIAMTTAVPVDAATAVPATPGGADGLKAAIYGMKVGTNGGLVEFEGAGGEGAGDCVVAEALCQTSARAQACVLDGIGMEFMAGLRINVNRPHNQRLPVCTAYSATTSGTVSTSAAASLADLAFAQPSCSSSSGSPYSLTSPDVGCSPSKRLQQQAPSPLSPAALSAAPAMTRSLLQGERARHLPA